MRLSELLRAAGLSRQLTLDPDITGVTSDSRRAGPGSLFVAIAGFKQDGHEFIADAASRGAVAACVERPMPAPAGMELVQVQAARTALAALAGALHGFPSRDLRVIGVTGTSGKTTTTFMTRHLWRDQGRPLGLMGTVVQALGDDVAPAVRTTPEATDIQDFLDKARQAKVAGVVMEVSSMALVLERVASVSYDIGVLTNLTPEHLDDHGTFDAYRAAKGLLFQSLGQDRAKTGPRGAVLNADDPNWEYFAALTRVPVLTFGQMGRGDLQALDVSLEPRGSRFSLRWRGQTTAAYLPLPGRYNVSNALAAVSTGLIEGFPLSELAESLAAMEGVPGRFQLVSGPGQPAVIIDYAHTTDALVKVLTAAREATPGELWVVFGCGGDRDPSKRPQMGAAAARLAHHTVVTSDNPRTEDPLAIIGAVEEGYLSEAGRPPLRAPDRRSAIRLAVSRAGPADTVVIAGKGHETYQEFGDRTVPFDDAEEARAALRERGHA